MRWLRNKLAALKERLPFTFDIEFEVVNSRQHYRSDGVEKIDYQSAERAEASASALSVKTGSSYDAYQCDMCHGFHIGKTPS